LKWAGTLALPYSIRAAAADLAVDFCQAMSFEELMAGKELGWA
jgi:hypothetical protein